MRCSAGRHPASRSRPRPWLASCAIAPTAIEASEELLGDRRRRRSGQRGAPLAFEAALAVSALSLLDAANLRRLKICPNCNWLFLDKSRNSSRLWCDMAVCGNRAKARQHYNRQKMQREKTDA